MRSLFSISLSIAIGALAANAADASPVISSGSKASQQVATPNPVLLTVDDIRSIRSRPADFASLVRKCGAEIDYQPKPVSVFAPEPHYTETGINQTDNNPKQLAADSLAAYRQGLCYVVTNDPKFAVAVHRIVDAYANTMTAVTTGQGKSSINFNMPYMIAAANWTYGVNGWKSVEFDKFLRNVVLPVSAADRDNNHGMWAMLMEASAAVHLADPAILNKARTRWIEIMKGATAPDGTLTTEVARSGTTNWSGGPDKGKKGLAYTNYFLLPASMAAKIFADQGKPVWRGEGGDQLKAAFEKSAGWVRNPKTFPYYASNNGQLSEPRNVVFYPLLLSVYPNANAQAVLAEHGVSDGGFLLPKLYATGIPKKKRPMITAEARGKKKQ